jgi:hypothetical protein
LASARPADPRIRHDFDRDATTVVVEFPDER